MPRSRRKRTALASGVDGAALTPSAVTSTQSTERQYTSARISPSVIYDGRVENPDEVLKQFGSWEGLSFYARMLRQFPFLVGICMQWIAGINAIDRTIKAGEPGNKVSEDMARDARALYARVDGKEILNQHLLWGRFYGFSAVEKVWTKDAATGLLAPTKLFDLDPWLFKFGPNGEPYVLTAKDPQKGELADDPRKFMFFRWGSKHTSYGKGDLKFAYMPTWYIQQVLRFGVQAIERFGRPIPWLKYWRGMDPSEVETQKASLAAQFKNFVVTPTDEAKTTLEFPAMNITANGMAGKPELDFCRFMEGWCYIALISTQQTQDKTGGSRALESTRREIQMDQTPPGSQALDSVWTSQWLDEIGEVNWPNQPRSLWPRFDSDVDSSDYIDGSTVLALTGVITQLARNEIPQKVALETLVRGGYPRLKAIEMVEATVKERDSLASPAPPPMAAPPQTEDETGDEAEETAA